MDESLKQRLVGAAVLVSLAVIFVPMLLSTSSESTSNIIGTTIPAKDNDGFSSRVVPLDEPETPMLDERETVALALARELDLGQTARPRPPVAEPVPQANAAPALPEVRSPALEAAGIGESKDGPAAWAVQLGSFSSRQNAVALRDRLREKGYTAFVESAVGDRGDVTRVFVGPELERDKAVQAIEELRQQTKLKGIVVRYPRG